MALKFYLDTHIAKAAALQLRAKEIDVVRCEEVGMADASDAEHLQYAAENGRVMVSQDADFSNLHIQWQETGRQHAGILCIPRGLQGVAQISFTVKELGFYTEAERVGAIDYQTEIKNTIIYL